MKSALLAWIVVFAAAMPAHAQAIPAGGMVDLQLVVP